MSPFEFQIPTRVIFGPGSVDRLGAVAREQGGTRVLLVTDRGLVEAGHADHTRRSIEQAGLSCVVFDQVRENPTTLDVDRCVSAAREARVDFIVALGGGSSMDCAKGCNFLLTNGGRMADYWGVGKATKPMLPFIAVPTTTGTGSEMQSFALIADERTHQKMACGDRKALARMAILDPLLAVSQPRSVIACTGLDAVAHAVETAVTRQRTEASRLFSRESFRLAVANLPTILQQADDVAAMGGMMLAACWAGAAIEHSMLGAAHSMANPLTASFNVIHGHAVGLLLPHVVRFNAQDPSTRDGYAELARTGGLASPDGGADAAVSVLVTWLERVLIQTDLPNTLSGCGVQERDIDALAQGAAKQWTAQFNPRPVTAREFAMLYRAALGAGVAAPLA
ncbi:MAG: iron-containing alcohol dehydrogenase [Phycisphaeraceae bacterium]|nr:MAG: iron-containing alcohol dehydrogenase [Phycisphaeraceae bacterium]